MKKQSVYQIVESILLIIVGVLIVIAFWGVQTLNK